MNIFILIIVVVLAQFVAGYIISTREGLNKATLRTRTALGKTMSRVAGEGYAHRILVAFDIFVNVVVGGNEDETISSRVGRVSDAHPNNWTWNPGVWIAKVLNGWLDCIQPDHRQKAQAGDLERAETAEHIEESALDETMTLHGDAAKAFAESLLNPPAANPDLRAAADRHHV